MTNRKLARNIGVMSIGVSFSRVFGLIRDQVMAYFFGTTIFNDAFNVGYNIPNLLRRLFGEGALSTAFVPIYAEIGEKDSAEAQQRFALNLLSILSLILLFLTLCGVFLAPYIVRLLYPGLASETSLMAIKLTRIMFPYLFFIGLSSTMIAVLNSHDYFFMTGLSSALLNIAMILFLIIPHAVFGLSGERLLIWSAWGVIVGGLFQTLINFPFLKKIGYRWKLYLDFTTDAIRMLWKRFIPSMIGIGVREINLIADSLMASFLPIGSITALGFGNRLMQLPLGIFAISAGTAVLPLYSRCVSRGEYGELSENMRFTTLSMAYLMLPITTLIIALGNDFVSILFQSGAFDARAALMTSQALVYYSLGLFFFSMNQTLTPLFYANKDTSTPVKLASAMVAINITLNFILMQFIQHRGLALSTSITSVINFLLLISLIKRKMPSLVFKGLIIPGLKVIFCCVLIYLLAWGCALRFPVQGRLPLLGRDAIIVAACFVLFYALGRLLHLDYLSELSNKLWQRFRRN